MQFRKYITCLEQLKKDDPAEFRRIVRSEKDHTAQTGMLLQTVIDAPGNLETFRQQIALEAIHSSEGRPFYNVWPAVFRMLSRIPDDLHVPAVKLPGIGHGQAIELRLPACSVLLCYRNQSAMLQTESTGGSDLPYVTLGMPIPEGQTVGEIRQRLSSLKTEGVKTPTQAEGGDAAIDEAIEMVPKILGCLPLLVDKSLDLLTRDVCQRDEGKPMTEEVLARAEKRKGLGWDLGRKLTESETSPHTRRSHWAIRWMRPEENEQPVKDGLVPRLRPVKASVVKSSKITEIPTGFESKKESDPE